MRIIAGSARGRQLEAFTGREIRPTPDRVREALFSSLFSRLGGFGGLRVLDLFAGSGALALEALSRGAGYALLVDRGEQAARLQRGNIERCGFADRAEQLSGEVLSLLPRLVPRGPFDLVFLDPPYGQGLVPRVLEHLATPGMLANGALVCAETARKDPLADVVGPLEKIGSRNYGITALHTFAYIDKQGNQP
ncbi:16S rRNA (guanine(966)-N(2))-methyltransferase RsmD [Desulfuromonas carbonis]